MKRTKFGFVLIAILVLSTLASCEWINNLIDSRTRNIALITIYNSNREKTNLLQPNDTLYVEVKGLVPDNVYDITCKDPEGKVISVLTAQANENGEIPPTPLWYDVGLVKKTYTIGGVEYVLALLDSEQLSVNAFQINVKDSGSKSKALGMTNFSLPFFVVIRNDVSRPQPIVIAGKMVSGEFVAENNFNSGDELYVLVYNLQDIVPSVTSMRVYLVPFKGAPYEDGEAISNPILYQDFTPAQLTAGAVKVTGTGGWIKDSIYDLSSGITTAMQGKAYSVILDCNGNSNFDILKAGMTDYYIDGVDGNMVPGFVVTKPPTAAVIEANIASGGKFTFNYSTWGYDYDYRDTFKKDGSDTQYAYNYVWTASGYDYAAAELISGYGIKAIWNPYIDWGGWTTSPPTPASPSLYYGTYVDVYIVAKADYTTTDGAAIKSAPGTRMWTLPVQYSCYNGCSQQTIWKPTMVVGDYYIVVDVDRSGTMTKDDIVDDLDSTGAVRGSGGFSVVD